MKYTLLIYSGRPGISLEGKQSYQERTRLALQPKANGQGRVANPLQSVPAATIVRGRDGKCLVTDGPFAETHEALRIGHIHHEPAGIVGMLIGSLPTKTSPIRFGPPERQT